MPDIEEIEVKVKDDDGKDKPSEIDSLVKEWEEGGKHGPKPGSDRWNTIYYEAQESKRAKERASELERTLSEAAAHNKQLAEAIEKLAGNLEKPDERPAQIESKITELRAAKKSAREKADFDAEDRIDEELADLRFELRSIKSGKKEEKIEKKTEPKVDDDFDIEVYKSWIDENKAIMKNPRMKTFAIRSEGEIRKDPDFEYASDEEILEEVKKRVITKFGAVKGTDLVEGDGEAPKRELEGTVKLGKTELEIAKGLGITQDDLAKQKLNMQRINAALGSRRK